MHLRRVHPEHPRPARADVAVAVRQVVFEEERIAGRERVRDGVDRQLDLALDDIADRLALVRDRVLLVRVGLDDVDVALEEVASGEWGIGGKALHSGDIVGMRAAVQ